MHQHGRPLRAAFSAVALLALSQVAQAQTPAETRAETRADVLRVEGRDGTVAEAAVADGAEWCLSWNHSVTGGAVADCFRNDGGRMILSRSYLHDFAAGLGTVEGRGTIRSAPGGGYWIEDMNEPVAGGALVLRVGAPAVAHRLRIVAQDSVQDVAQDVALSDLAAGQRVILRLIPAR